MKIDDHEIKFDGRTLGADVFMRFRGREDASRYGFHLLTAAKGPLLRMTVVGVALALDEHATLIPVDPDAKAVIPFQLRILVNTDEPDEALANRLRDQLARDRRSGLVAVGLCDPREAGPAWRAANQASIATLARNPRGRA